MPTPLSLYDTLLQAYQGTAQTAGPFSTLSSIFQPYQGQTGLTDQQQQMFGYTVGPGQTIGTPYTPYGGFVGDPSYGGVGGFPSFGPPAPTYGSPYGAPGAYSGGGSPAYGPPAPAGTPGATPTGMTLGGAPVSSAPAGAPPSNINTGQVYSPTAGMRIGNGIEFQDPYAGQTGPGSSPGYHPGTLGLNTTALSAYGPAATAGILQANPFLANAMGYQALAEGDASNPLQNSAILNQLNQLSSTQLNQAGQLSPEQERANSQAALSAFTNAGAGTGSNNAIAAQLFGRQNEIDQRMQQAIANAQQTQGLNFTQQGQELQRQGLAGSLATQAAGTATSAITNPILQILGLGSLNGTSDPSQTIANQNSLINPFLQAGLQVAGANFNAQNAQDIANQNQDAATTSGLLSLGGGLLSGISDERLKKNVKKVGESPSGTPEFEWVYKLDPYKKKYHGTTAQALEKTNPSAVVTDPVSGLKVVNYAKTDVPFYEISNPYLKAA